MDDNHQVKKRKIYSDQFIKKQADKIINIIKVLYDTKQLYFTIPLEFEILGKDLDTMFGLDVFKKIVEHGNHPYHVIELYHVKNKYILDLAHYIKTWAQTPYIDIIMVLSYDSYDHTISIRLGIILNQEHSGLPSLQSTKSAKWIDIGCINSEYQYVPERLQRIDLIQRDVIINGICVICHDPITTDINKHGITFPCVHNHNAHWQCVYQTYVGFNECPLCKLIG